MMTKKHAGKEGGGGKEKAKMKRVCEDDTDTGGEKKSKHERKICYTEAYSCTKFKSTV